MRSVRRHATTLNLPTLRLEGGLFLPDVLEKAALGLARLQTEADYRLPKGLKFKDEYSRAFQIASAQWRAFAPLLERTDVPAQHASASFITELLHDALAYPVVAASAGLTVGDRHYPITHLATGPAGAGGALSHAIPIVVAPHTLGLDEPHPRFAVHHADGGNSGSRKKSAFQLAQELLNASPDHHWALVSNGKTLRLLRDAATLTRPSYLDIDLQDLLAGQRLAEFAYAWRLLHASRAGLLPGTDDSSAPLAWEAWREAGQEEGTRVRNGLRRGVTQALITLGQGFVQHPANNVLRQALQDGSLGKDAYYAQLLRLIYRFIFVFSVEERALIPSAPQPSDDEATLRAKHAAAQAYAQGYALTRLRDLALRRRARNRFDDLWQGVKIVFQGLAHGQPRLGLPALGGLFAPTQCPALDAAQLSNADLLAAMHSLRWARQPGAPLAPIDYRNMGTEELGSVYESLLELVPEVDLPARRFGFIGLNAEGNTTSTVAGNDRKLTGSYYTPDSLVQQLIYSALDPVIDQRLAAQPADPVRALLAIRVIDPACGSGHFLLAAARRLAEKLAQLRSLEGGQEGSIKPQDYRHALREVVAHCIYGVDRNPMAIELARMALWLEGYEEGRPLGFLEHHLQVGDALLGLTDLHALERGIAKEAFKPLSGDDKDICKQLAKANAHALKQLNVERTSPQSRLHLDNASGLAELQALEALPEDSTQQIAAKANAWDQYLRHARNHHLALAADLLLGAYLLPKTEGMAQAIPTTSTLYLTLLGSALPADQQPALAAAKQACAEARVFHWPLAFPQVFAQGGFDCVLANPPWERIKLQEEEFFATRHRDVFDARNKAERAQRIQWLGEGMLARHLYPELAHEAHEDEAEQRIYREFISARRTAEAASLFAHVNEEDGGRYPLTGIGDVNTYALFAETISQIHSTTGRGGFIVPSGIATDDTTKRFFQFLVNNQKLISLFGFDNARRIFPSVHPDTPFSLVTIGATDGPADLAHYLLSVEDLTDPRRRFALTPDEFRLINPNTLTCPVFRSERDAELTKKLYRAAPVLMRDAVIAGEGKQAMTVRPAQNPWGISFMAMLHMSNDSHLFKDAPALNRLPLYEAKLIHQFDHRWATYAEDGGSRDVTAIEKASADFTVAPRYWVNRSEVEERLSDKGSQHGWLMGWRDITNATNERTVIASVMPVVGVGNQLPLMLFAEREDSRPFAALLGNLDALVFDFVARHKTGGTHMNYFIYKQLPVLPPDRYTEADLAHIVPRVLELTYVAHDLVDWAKDLGYGGPPFSFDADRRAILRAELDAYYAKLYGLTQDELRYILDPADVMGEDYPSETFRVLKNKELRELGEYRTQRLVLAAWDALRAQPPVNIPAPQPVRRTVPLPIYLKGGTPASEAEDWLAGLVCDVLIQAGPCDDSRLRLILLAPLPNNIPSVEVLPSWLAPVNTERWGHMRGWLHDLLGIPITAPLSIRNPEALADVIGDHRTQSLATALIQARDRREAALKETLAGSTSAVQSHELRKQG
ncbi:SAM-dependent DNA methyltransferase [Variovorax guangxiensis]|uniref:site-specific DNA-methyltransferase (adenine-specific) n=1 Tax=Variovorax guangxiensis TaxID=1775474 RepID=A0A433MSX4_9BURK|nr:N-6 DNA methylase [Variovorax guangxiensis]RUR70938.1 SAM-dependent DNA methyltransferase [Variovorax guangxiensis]